MGESLASAGVRSVLEGGRGVGDDGELLDLTFGYLQYDPFVLPCSDGGTGVGVFRAGGVGRALEALGLGGRGWCGL